MTKDNNPSVYQHYIPRFQLRYLLNQDGLLYLYDRKEKRFFSASPNTVGGSKKIYTYKDRAGKEHTEVEELNTQIESVAAPIVKRLHFREISTITPQEKADLSILLALNWLRTPAARERINVLTEAGFIMHFRMKALDKETFYNEVAAVEEKIGKDFGDKEKLRMSIINNRFRAKFDNLAYVRWVVKNLLEFAQVIQNMAWVILSLGEKRSFVLNDLNFMVEQIEPPPPPYGSGGLLSPGTQSMCILTNKLAILLRPQEGEIHYSVPDPKFIKSCNVISASRTQRFLYSNSSELLRRIVTDSKIELFPPEKIGVEVYSGPEGKILRFDKEHGLIL